MKFQSNLFEGVFITVVIDCKKLSESILNECIKQKRNKNLSLLIISVGSDPASESYVRGKKKDCEKCGIDCYHFSFPSTIAPGAFYSAVSKLANDNLSSGVIIQLPLPKSIDTRVALNLIPPKKDIDGLTSFNAGGIYLNHPSFFPCTPLGVVKIIESLNLDSEKYKDVVIIGRSDLVGKPLALMLTHMNYTVTLCHSKTKNLPQKTKNADIVISAAGVPSLVTENMIKDGAVVIDVGINRTVEGKLVGDVDFENVSKKAGYITPVPGGVGLMTRAMLIHNLCKCEGV